MFFGGAIALAPSGPASGPPSGTLFLHGRSQHPCRHLARIGEPPTQRGQHLDVVSSPAQSVIVAVEKGTHAPHVAISRGHHDGGNIVLQQGPAVLALHIFVGVVILAQLEAFGLGDFGDILV